MSVICVSLPVVVYDNQQEARNGEVQCKGFVDASKYMGRIVLQKHHFYDNAPTLSCCD